MRSQDRDPEPNRYYVVQTTSRYQPQCMVQSSAEDRPGTPRQRGLLVHVVFHSLCTNQNCLCLTPTYVHGKIAPCSASSGHSEASAARSVYGSPYGRRRD